MARNQKVKVESSGQGVTIDPPPLKIEQIHEQVKARMEALKPLVEEYYQLEAADQKLAGIK